MVSYLFVFFETQVIDITNQLDPFDKVVITVFFISVINIEFK